MGRAGGLGAASRGCGSLRQAQDRLSGPPRDSGPAHQERVGWTGNGYPQGAPLHGRKRRTRGARKTGGSGTRPYERLGRTGSAVTGGGVWAETGGRLGIAARGWVGR